MSAAPLKSGSNLERILASGGFAVTAELGPPKHADPAVIAEKAELLVGVCDAANITDNQSAVARMSSVAAAKLSLDAGVEPIPQMTCRDRNRLAMQADILGAHALGLRNLLCLTGDHQSFGNHPQAKNVHDLDSMALLAMAKGMRDDSVFLCGEEIKVPPRLFLGAAENPFADPFDYRPYRTMAKAAAGADFIQTQIIYNVDKFREYMKRLVALGVTEQTKLLAGVAPLKSAGVAKYMKNRVAGMEVPDQVVARMEGAAEPKAEGISVCVEIIRECMDIEGVAGVHIMAVEWEEAVREIAEQAGLLPRPAPGPAPGEA
jgi:methylenetetrahydrofolate reductase (NADPH)